MKTMEVQDVNTLCVWLPLASICPIWLTLATGCPSLLLLSHPVIYFWESLEHISQVPSVAAIFFPSLLQHRLWFPSLRPSPKWGRYVCHYFLCPIFFFFLITSWGPSNESPALWLLTSATCPALKVASRPPRELCRTNGICMIQPEGNTIIFFH